MDYLTQQLINGLSIGATYALIALGYTMVYGVLRLINFAHGEVYMMGAVVAYWIAIGIAPWGWPVWGALAVIFGGAMGACAVLGFAIEFFAYRPLRNKPRLVVLITAIGVSLLLQNLAQTRYVFGPTPEAFPAVIEAKTVVRWTMGGPDNVVTVSNLDLLSLGLSLGLMGVLAWVVLRTRQGLALRAVSYRFDTSSLMGINTNRTISFTFMLGSALAAVAGVVDAIRYDVRPLMGLMPGLKAFVAAVLGGIGSIPGAFVGGLVIGLIETLVKGYLSSAYSDAVAFVVLIVILLVRPSGILGRYEAEKL
ncbi:MAG: branched-chain amino acid ABC transporter permease [Planctomycetota bacterium]|nr:branched-chain amino acid ABC transporter permease [Planctomycetota bacterium]